MRIDSLRKEVAFGLQEPISFRYGRSQHRQGRPQITGGEIERGSPGAGSRVHETLQRLQNHPASAAAVSPAASRSASPSPARSHHPRILVLDDRRRPSIRKPKASSAGMKYAMYGRTTFCHRHGQHRARRGSGHRDSTGQVTSRPTRVDAARKANYREIPPPIAWEATRDG